MKNHKALRLSPLALALAAAAAHAQQQPATPPPPAPTPAASESVVVTGKSGRYPGQKPPLYEVKP